MAVVSGGTTLIDNGALDTAVPSGKLVLLSTQTASASASISFTSGIDSTYDSYVFKFINIHNNTDNGGFNFQCSTDGGSNYNTTVTSTAFRAEHNEEDNDTILGYRNDTNWDQAQGTAFQRLIDGTGNGADESGAGTLTIYNPANTTFVKHWMSNTTNYHGANYVINYYFAGYFNTTSAINAVRFSTFSGNFDGIIKLYGVG
jgi:hypothetical protein